MSTVTEIFLWHVIGLIVYLCFLFLSIAFNKTRKSLLVSMGSVIILFCIYLLLLQWFKPWMS